MATFRMPIEANVWTTAGPWRVGDLHTEAVLLIIGPNGRPTSAPIMAISDLVEREVARLLTSAGEIHLDPESAVSTRGTRMFAGDVASDAVAGRLPRIELAHPEDLPSATVQNDLSSALRGALALIDPPVVRIPRRLSASTALLQLFLSAGVRYHDASDERWTALTFDPAEMSPPTMPPGPADANALQAITAWTHGTPNGTVCRTTLGQTRLRQRLVAALAVIHTPAKVSWTPGYGPVEARIVASSGDAFASARHANTTVMPCVDVETNIQGSAIVDLAILQSRRLTHCS